MKDWRHYFRKEKTETEKILNVGVLVVVGGSGEYEPKEVRLRAPSINRLFEHFAHFAAAFRTLGENERAWVEEAIDKPTNFLIEDLQRFQPIKRAVEEFGGGLINEEPEYVGDDMSLEQLTQLLSAFIQVAGIQTIVKCFLAAKAEIMSVMKPAGPPPQPTDEPAETGQEIEMEPVFDPSAAQS